MRHYISGEQPYINKDEMFWLQAFFLTVFILEAVIKIVSLGFAIGEGHYLQCRWNFLDFIIIIAGSIDIASSGGGQIVMMRLMRTLQPLRALNKFRSGRMVELCKLDPSLKAPPGFFKL